MSNEGIQAMPRATAAVDPVAMLKTDHEKVKGLFDQFEQTENKRTKARISREAITELEVHAGIEEEIFYPAYNEEVDAEDTEAAILEAEEEHHVVHLLIAELKAMDPMEERYEAKFTVLMENVRHHIEEEENELLPKSDQMGEERLAELGMEMAERKKVLQREFKAEAKSNGAAAMPAAPRATSRGATRATGTTAAKRGAAAQAGPSNERASRARAATPRSSARSTGGTTRRARS